jgi:hypothetical protein
VPKGPYQGQPGEIIDPSAVPVYRGGQSLDLKPGDIRVGKDGLVQTTHGISLDTDPSCLAPFGGARRVVSVPDGLQIKQRGRRPTHFEVVPKKPLTPDHYKELVRQIEVQ